VLKFPDLRKFSIHILPSPPLPKSIKVVSKAQRRMTVKALLFVVASFALAAIPIAVAAAPPSNANQVKGTGCVQAGVEAGCLVVRDAASGNLYSLLIKGAKPAVGIGIDFAGAPFTGSTTCMQGTPVQISTWSHNESLQCAATRAKGKSVQ
jgi:hypothetical protein